MWGVRIVTLVAAATMTAAGAVSVVTPAAWAGSRDEPIIADVNGDGLPDRNVLGMTNGPAGSVTCQVVVRLGLAGGGFGQAQPYPYLTLPADDPNCPDMGVGINLDGDPEVELAVTWFAGPPISIRSTLLVLDNFAVSGGFDTIYQPSYIGTADFNGDGRADIYEWTDQGSGFSTYLNTAGHMLVPGPVKYCSGPPQFQLADFNRNGAMDVAISYIEGCDEFFSGVVVVLDDGTQVNLEGDLLGDNYWTIDVTDANNDSIPDVITHNQITGRTATYLGVGDGTFVPNPRAIRDYPTVSGRKGTQIDVLANDYATSSAKVSIWRQPKHGTVKVTGKGKILYTPSRSHGRNDSFVYRITDNGRTSNAAVCLKFAD